MSRLLLPTMTRRPNLLRMPAECRCCSTTSQSESRPSEIFRLVSLKDIDSALELCADFAKAINLTPSEFLSKQCSERSYLIYRLSTESRADALNSAQYGEAYTDRTKPGDLLSDSLWHEDVKEQYVRAWNCVNLSETALRLGSPDPARDYQIIGRSVVHKLLLGRSATVLQTFMSRTLQSTKKPYEWAIANHRKAATLFDDVLAPPGPTGPLEAPESARHDVSVFKSWSEQRTAAAHQHMRLIVHLTSDVARNVLPRAEGEAFLEAAKVIFAEEIDEERELIYAQGVIRSTLRAL